MKLDRDIGVTQKTAWFMLHRIREAWNTECDVLFVVPVEVDETYMGGKESYKHWYKKLNAGRGVVGKTAVVGAKDRDTNQVSASSIVSTDKELLREFVIQNTAPEATVYTDDHKSYTGLPYKHETVKHSAGEFVRDQVNTNGVESFWALRKRTYYGTYHKISVKNLNRYVNEFTGKHNIRELNTIDQMLVSLQA